MRKVYVMPTTAVMLTALFWLDCGQQLPIAPQAKALTKPASGFANVPAETFRNQLLAEGKKLLQLFDEGARVDGGLPTDQSWTMKFGAVRQTSSVGFVWKALSKSGKVLEQPWAGLFFDDNGQVTGIVGVPYIVLGIINPGGKSTWALFALSSIIPNQDNTITLAFSFLKTGLSLVEAGVHTVVADELISSSSLVISPGTSIGKGDLSCPYSYKDITDIIVRQSLTPSTSSSFTFTVTDTVTESFTLKIRFNIEERSLPFPSCCLAPYLVAIEQLVSGNR